MSGKQRKRSRRTAKDNGTRMESAVESYLQWLWTTCAYNASVCTEARTWATSATCTGMASQCASR